MKPLTDPWQSNAKLTIESDSVPPYTLPFWYKEIKATARSKSKIFVVSKHCAQTKQTATVMASGGSPSLHSIASLKALQYSRGTEV